ncbi:MAG TPA: GNAT family N-acetyltransferase [Burkholderiaceae bacterium]
MPKPVTIRPVQPSDYTGWRPLWDGYNAFYGRSGPTALAEEITAATWSRFFDAAEPVEALVAEASGRVVGLVHCISHRSTNRLQPVCYLQDLFTDESLRGQGIGRLLIEAAAERALQAGSSRLYWHTHEGNAPARALYDKLARHMGFIVYSQDL